MLEAGLRVPLERLQPAMEDWFRRKGYLKPDEKLEVREVAPRFAESQHSPSCT
jgi:hypothetical protein